MTNKKLIPFLLLLMVIMTAMMWIESSYWKYYPFEPVVFHSGITIKNPQNTVCAGDLLIYEMEIDRKMDVPVMVKRQLVNSYQIDYPKLEVPNKNLGIQKVYGSVHIPSYVDPGQYTLRWTGEYIITSDRSIYKTFESQKFNVVNCRRP